MGGINFGWLAVWFPSPDWLCRKSDFCQALRWSRHAWGGECGPCPNLTSYTLIFALQLRKITENSSHGSRKTLGWLAPNAIRLVDLAIVGDSFDWPAGSCHPWLTPQATGSTLGQRKYLLSCRTRGFSTSANLESRLAVRALMWLANSGTPWSSCICLLRTRGSSSKAKALWIATPVTSGHGRGQRTTRGTHNPWGGWAAYITGLCSWRRDHSSIQEGTQHTHPLSCSSPDRCEATRWVV